MDPRYFLIEYVPIANQYGGVWIAVPGSYDSLESAQEMKRELEADEHEIEVAAEVDLGLFGVRVEDFG
jgi:hypothetical protein